MLKKIGMHIKRRWLLPVFAYSAKMMMRMLLKTCRIRIQGIDTFIHTAASSPCMLMLWHHRLIIISEILNTYAGQYIYTAFISKSRDGDPLALLATSYKNGRALRVPHNGRHFALNQLMAALTEKKEVVIITPDGPRGPSGIVKPGIVFAARETKANIFPFSWKASKSWQLKTWDGMQIPKPFSSIEITFGQPLILTDDSEGYDEDVSRLKQALDSL